MARKGENIYKRKDGRWEGRYAQGRDASGKLLYGSVYGRSYAEVKERLAPMRAKALERQIGARFRGTYREWALRWLAGKVPQLKPSSYAVYYTAMHVHILPALGDKRLRLLEEADAETFVGILREKGLSAGTIRGIVQVLRASLQKAVKARMLPFNPCEDVALPRRDRKPIRSLTLAQQRKLELTAMQHPNGLPVILALYTGMRVGEICALKWENVDLKAGYIHVMQTVQRIRQFDGRESRSKLLFGTPKSEKSRRSIPMGTNLRTYLMAQAFQAQGEYLVHVNGNVTEPRTVEYRFGVLLKLAGLDRVSFHTLRHTFATRAIESGADITNLSSLLGHASVTLTLETYTDSHVGARKTIMLKLDKSFMKTLLPAPAEEKEDELNAVTHSGQHHE